MSKLIYISHEPLTKYLYKLFFLEEVQSAGIEIEYWDCSNISWKGIILPDMISAPYIKKIKDVQSFYKEISQTNLNSTIFSVELRQDKTNLEPFKILTEFKCYIISFKLFENAVLPITIKEVYRSIQSGKIIKDVINKFRCSFEKKRISYLYKQNKIKDFDIVFSSSYNSGNILINHPDYDEYLKHKNFSLEKKHIVYIDNYFPFHPDIKTFNKNIDQVNIIQHYKEINTIFKKLETKYNTEVIIAAHPKADYQQNVFEGRKIIKYKTQELISNAKLVILHSSNAIAFAIAYNIPFMFISTSQYKLIKTEYYRMRRLSSYFKAPIITIKNIDKELQRPHHISTKYIQKYKYTFLTKPDIENQFNKDIIISTLKNSFKNINKYV